jgi:phage I-like protein
MLIYAAALTQPVGLGKAFRIMPAGKFRSMDGSGRPALNQDWFLSEERGKALVAAAAARPQDYLIDYDHQSLKGSGAVAAGWFRELAWQPDGLYIQNPNWTDAAKNLIASNQYRYVSPTFKCSSDTYEVLELVNIAITNSPALLGLTDLSKVALTQSQEIVTVSMPSDAEMEKIAWLTGKTVAVLKANMQKEEAARQAKESAGAGARSADYFHRIFSQ